MDFAKLLEMLQEQGKANFQNIHDVNKQMQDRIKMDDPSLQGPRLPDTTPEEEQFADNNLALVAGAVSPLGGKVARMPMPTSKEATAMKVANEVMDNVPYIKDVQKTQQALNREVEFANRARQQKFDRIQKALGRK